MQRGRSGTSGGAPAPPLPSPAPPTTLAAPSSAPNIFFPSLIPSSVAGLSQVEEEGEVEVEVEVEKEVEKEEEEEEKEE